jgi:hypothetical protein
MINATHHRAARRGNPHAENGKKALPHNCAKKQRAAPAMLNTHAGLKYGQST